MIKKIFSFGVIVLLLLVFFSGCLERDIVEGKGEIRYVDLEGGFYGIISYDGEKYDPVNLPNDFKIDGLHVRFRLRVLSEENSFHMWGKVIYLIEIKKISANGRLKNFTGCKSFFEDDTNTSQDCIEYNYDGGVLFLKHINAGFNCCSNITANFTISDDKIIIEEIEISGECDCLCLFDIDYEFINLEPGVYTITVDEPYRHEDEKILEFTVDLNRNTSGVFCVDRYHYPWG